MEVAHATVTHYEAEARAGQLSEADAKRLAMTTLRDMRYDKIEYFWINDLNDVMVMHPYKPALDGTKLDQIQDSTGKHLFVEFNQVVKSQGAGYVDYLWPKPGADNTTGYPKISYVQGFAPWGWVIGTGVYVDDIEAQFRRSAVKLLLWGVGMGGCIAAVLLLITRNITTTLGGDPRDVSTVARRIAQGDLSQAITAPAGSNLMADVKGMQETLRRMIDTILKNSEQLSSSADELLSTAEEVAERTLKQSDAASAMAASVEQMAVSIDQVKENARESHDLAANSAQLASQGAEVIHATGTAISTISGAAQATAGIVTDLGQQSAQITTIVNTIRDIAEQTNLLALNAAIEAARAGEQGRGFAVVADEVRKLAERTSLSTREIGDMVGKIQAGTQAAVDSMVSGVDVVNKGVSLAGEAGAAINGIRDDVARVSTVVNSIAATIAEQSLASTDIAQKVESIAQMSEESSTAMQHTLDAAQHLHRLAGELQATVSHFKT